MGFIFNPLVEQGYSFLYPTWKWWKDRILLLSLSDAYLIILPERRLLWPWRHSFLVILHNCDYWPFSWGWSCVAPERLVIVSLGGRLTSSFALRTVQSSLIFKRKEMSNSQDKLCIHLPCHVDKHQPVSLRRLRRYNPKLFHKIFYIKIEVLAWVLSSST